MERMKKEQYPLDKTSLKDGMIVLSITYFSR
jgi:hypothetical protein